MNAHELIDKIEMTIGHLHKTYRSSATESDLYEASLFLVAIRALSDAGATVLLTNDGENAAPSFRFRCSPGNLWSPGFTYAVAEFRTAAGLVAHCEVHLGIYVAGVSGVAHECDVAVLKQTEAQRSRDAKTHPRRRGLIGVIEAKHYVASPGIGIGRSFLGLAGELGSQRCALAFPARSSANLWRLLAPKGCQCFDEVLPASEGASRLRAHLEQAIRNSVV